MKQIDEARLRVKLRRPLAVAIGRGERGANANDRVSLFCVFASILLLFFSATFPPTFLVPPKIISYTIACELRNGVDYDSPR